MSDDILVADAEALKLSEQTFDPKVYPMLAKFVSPMQVAQREILGRKKEINQLLAAMYRPELCNAMLLAPAGSGKTALVQATALVDTSRVYMEVDLAKMIAGLKNLEEMASILKQLFDEAEAYVKAEGIELVLFIDEFHQIVQLSAAAVEALKPILAASGTRGIRVIAATTNEEFHKYIAENQPLVERLQRINLSQTDRATTVAILRGMAERYGVSRNLYDDTLFEMIYEYTNRYIPASSQPRKSILLLDSMVGWHRLTNAPMDKKLLAEVLLESTNVNVAFNVDATKIKEQLDSKVFAQDLATSVVARRLQLCVADLQDKSKPMASFLFTGSTGTGKAQVDSTLIPGIFKDGTVGVKPLGDIVPGDKVFNRLGEPATVLGVFPQGKRDVYRITFSDGRTQDVSDNHLWAVYPSKRSRSEGFTIYTTQTLINKGLETRHKDRVGCKYSIPMNGEVIWPKANLDVDPYALGSLIADGSLTEDHVVVSGDDEYVIERVANAIGAKSYKRGHSNNWNWIFYQNVEAKGKRVQLSNILTDSSSSLIGLYSKERYIPDEYKYSSVEQRWNLIQGLFDCDGSIGQYDGERFNISYSSASRRLVEDIQFILYSLGVSSTISKSIRENKNISYVLHVKSSNDNKYRFFSTPVKLSIAQKAVGVNRQRNKSYDVIGIKSIEKLDYQESMTCIYIDDDEHLYQAGDFIVTHNTELTKQLAALLFGDDNHHLIRFDMSEYALDDSLPSFKSELTKAVWNNAHSVLLFDEIEKAAPTVVRLMLQMLDDGRLSDDNNRTVSFLNTYIVLTTNAASEIYETIAQYAVDDEGSGRKMSDFKKVIHRSLQSQGGDKFPPELLGRIDAIVPFQPLSSRTIERIIKGKLQEMIREVGTKHGVKVTVNSRVLSYLAADKEDTDSNAGGARNAINLYTDEVLASVAQFLNENPYVKHIYIAIDGALTSENKSSLKSNAKVVVVEYTESMRRKDKLKG